MFLSRRKILIAGGSALPIPFLPSISYAKNKESPIPKRLIFLSQGWGNAQSGFLPDREDTGVNYKLTPSMEPLKKHKDKFSVFQGFMHNLTAISADPHWASTFWLTGANRYGKPGSSFSNTISVDQVAAKAWSSSTRYASLQLDCPTAAKNSFIDGHGAGLSLSWDDQGRPLSSLESPIVVFHRLFSDENISLEERRSEIAAGRSILDALKQDMNLFENKMSQEDRYKFREYTDSIRDIEIKLANDEKWLGTPKPKIINIKEPSSSLKGIDEINVMYDLMIAAFKTDSTRVITYRQPVSTLYESMGLSVNTHEMSHSPADHPAVRARDKKQLELLAGLIDRLLETKESDGSNLFDHTTVAFGSNLRSVHYLDNVTTILCGGGAGIQMGGNFNYPDKTPLCNVWLSMLKGSGVDIDRFGDSTETIKELKI